MSDGKIGSWSSLIKKTIHFIDRLYWFWLIVAAPFLLFPSAKRSLLLLVIPGTWLIHWLDSRLEFPNKKGESSFVTGQHSALSLTSLNLALLLLAVMVLVSLWTTYDLSYSLGKIAGVVLGFGVFFAIVRSCATSRGFWVSLGVFVCSGLGIAVLGLFGTNWFLTKITILNPIFAHLPGLIKGLQGAESGFHPNEVAGSLLWALPPLLCLLVVIFLRFRFFTGSLGILRTILWLISLLLTGLCVVSVFILAQSRAAYIGFAITITLLILVSLFQKWKWFFLAGLMVVFVIAGIVFATHWGVILGWINNNQLAENPAFSIGTLESRVAIWASAVKGIQDFPFTGMGMNTFRKLMPVLYPNPAIPTTFDIGHAHNEFLQAGVDLGIPGMIAFISLYIGAFWMLIRTWQTTFLFDKVESASETVLSRQGKSGLLTNCKIVRALIMGLGGGLLAHLLFGLVDAVALGAKPGFIFWLLLGLITGLYILIQKPVGFVTQVNE